MQKVIKKAGKIVKAYCLGEQSEVEKKLIREGKIIFHDNGEYELFSQEAVNGTGEKALKGDYFKLDSNGYPYPNDRSFFRKNHIQLNQDEYEQIPKTVMAWTKNEELSPEIEFLIKEKNLVIDKKSKNKYFNAPLWGSMLSAAEDAVILIYSVDRDANDKIIDIDFNFVARDEFNRDYVIL